MSSGGDRAQVNPNPCRAEDLQVLDGLKRGQYVTAAGRDRPGLSRSQQPHRYETGGSVLQNDAMPIAHTANEQHPRFPAEFRDNA